MVEIRSGVRVQLVSRWWVSRGCDGCEGCSECRQRRHTLLKRAEAVVGRAAKDHCSAVETRYGRRRGGTANYGRPRRLFVAPGRRRQATPPWQPGRWGTGHALLEPRVQADHRAARRAAGARSRIAVVSGDIHLGRSWAGHTRRVVEDVSHHQPDLISVVATSGQRSDASPPAKNATQATDATTFARCGSRDFRRAPPVGEPIRELEPAAPGEQAHRNAEASVPGC